MLVEIARNPRARIEDIAAAVGLTERTVQAIIADLEAAGYLTRTRAWPTVYTIHPDRPFRHPAQDGHRIGLFLELLAAPGDRAGDAARTRVSRSRRGAGRAGLAGRGCLAGWPVPARSTSR